ncbi:MAG: DUF3090 domain-containing protein [Actinobacteria bacterium]|jgi:uncharacterized repeat protein (TIGR03847 family)|nr:DUF3090 domain-containing protein [Gammaproteobacteria bacterium]NBS27962.1 DUF3090 domain-containing protein [Actinomycetota bacterium]NBT27235.1 DUF3090 domain-containing protein [Actinomycetota bacterium]NBY12425.1 DUF3090 domain-containing protein [Actinomycetota bacterium]NCZ90337.1 DUF3090 domain-containing protein [Actinomycetota bacterium]
MSTYFESDDVDAFTTAAIGEPGSRTFYLQIRSQGRHITMKCEKQQVAALSQYIRQLLADAPDVKERPLDDAMQMTTPLDVEFIVGTVGIAYDPRSDQMVIQIDEMRDDEAFTEGEDDEVGRVRIYISRGQAAAFCEHADDVVAAGRPACIFCGRPKNVDGHACPRMN